MDIDKLKISYKGPAAKYSHEGDEPEDVNKDFKEQLTLGQRTADTVARVVGSWKFIIVQSTFFVFWMMINVILAIGYITGTVAWDPYPFILLNLMLSFEAAYTGPIIMMSQNRQAIKDRMVAESDFKINQKSEEETRIVMEHLVSQDKLLFTQTHTLLDADKKEYKQINDRLIEILELLKKEVPDATSYNNGTANSTKENK